MPDDNAKNPVGGECGMNGQPRIYRFEKYFFLFFGVFHIHNGD